MRLRHHILAAGLIAGAATVSAGIVVDGNLTDLGVPVSTQTESAGDARLFASADEWLDAIYYRHTPTTMHIGLEGNSSSGAHLLVFIDAGSRMGDFPQTLGVPPISGSGGAFGGADLVSTILDLDEIDYGFTGSSSDPGTGSGAFTFTVHAVDYTDDDGVGQNGADDAGVNDADPLGTDPVSGRATDTSSSSGTFTTDALPGGASVQFAYSDNDVAGLSGARHEGFELAIPLSVLGATGSDTVRLFAMYVSSTGSCSAHVLPPASGHGAFVIGSKPDFVLDAEGIGGGGGPQGAWGTQILGPLAVPAELSIFTAD